MDQQSAEDRWLEVLAGKAKPLDADTQNAAVLRAVLRDEKAQAEANASTEEADPAQVVRIMNALQARGAFVAPPAPTNPWLRLVRWLNPLPGPDAPSGARLAGRRAALAAGLAAVIALPLVLHDDPDAIPGDTVDKNLPPGIRSGGGSDPSAAMQTVLAADPEQLANSVREALVTSAVATLITSDSNGVFIQASVPAADRAAVARALSNLGIALPRDGELALHITAQR